MKRNFLNGNNSKGTSIQIFRGILISIVLSIFYYLLFFEYNGLKNSSWIICLIIMFLLSITTIYGLIYNLLVKSKK